MISWVLSLSCLVAAVYTFPYPFPDGGIGGPGPLPIPRPGSDGSYGGEQYFQYINVPAPKEFEWGYRRGNPDHNREEYLSQKDHTFKAKLEWHDAYGGHGEYYYDYNHGNAYKEEPHYAPPKPSYHPGLHSETNEQYVEAPEESKF